MYTVQSFFQKGQKENYLPGTEVNPNQNCSFVLEIQLKNVSIL